MIGTYMFFPKAIKIIVLVNGIKNIFLSLSFGAFDRLGKRENDNCINNRVNREQINEQAEELLEKYGNAILRLAYSYLHQMSDAEDILQDTIFQYIKTSPSFDSTNHEKAWLMRVAINLSKNKIIYNKKRETIPIDEDLFLEEEKDLAFVWDAVKSLPFKYSEVIHLFYQEGYTTAEIAEMLSKNEATIRSLLHRGRGKLKELLKEVYDFNE